MRFRHRTTRLVLQQLGYRSGVKSIAGNSCCVAGHSEGMTGDEVQAVTRLYERYAGPVHRYALRRSDRETADEVVAQVFMVAWRRRSALPEDALPWLYGVARRALAEQRRGAARRERLGARLRGEAIEETPSPVLPDEVLAGARFTSAGRRLVRWSPGRGQRGHPTSYPSRMARAPVATRCECCGAAAKLTHLAVRHRKSGDSGTLKLCT